MRFIFQNGCAVQKRAPARNGSRRASVRDTGGELARAVILLFAIISVIGFISYDFQGMGKFCKVFLPWDLSPNTYAIIIMSVTAIYVVLGGMLSVVLTDFVQFILMAISSVFIGVIAMTSVSAEKISSLTPNGWQNIFFGWTLDLNWNGILPAMDTRIAGEGWLRRSVSFLW